MQDYTEAEIVDEFLERAGIIEHEGHRDRATANKLAGICIRKRFGFVPQVVMEIIEKESGE